MGGDEIKFVQEAFASNWISPAGPHLQAFENELASWVGADHCVALSSGTAAIHLALIILGVVPGDEVICSSFTFSASCNPILYLGAKPVFIDSETDTWNMDPALLATAIEDRIATTGKKPKAIILVHLYGMPAKLNEVISISKRYAIPIIEDAAEALGSTYQGKFSGTFGEVGIYSFNGNKIITTSGGGALVSATSEWITKARFLATQAREQEPHYEHKEVGYNYRLSNVCAGIGRGQLKVLHEHVQLRRSVFEYYQSALQDVPVKFVREPESFFSNRWLTTVLFDSFEQRERVRLSLEKENIESRPLWKPMHVQPVFQSFPKFVNGVSEKLFETGLCLPSGSGMLQDEQDRVIEVLRKSMLSPE